MSQKIPMTMAGEMHGGTVTAQSEGHGMGSRFIVRLPAAGFDLHMVKPVAPVALEKLLAELQSKRV